MHKYFCIILSFALVILTGCNNSENSTTLSSVAQLTAFSFAANDSMPGLAAAVFTVEERVDTGLVWNKDSILYGTRLDSVVPRFTFAATPSVSALIFPDTTCRLTGYDTLDFTKTPIYLSIRSADKSTTKIYEIRPTVHQIDPDLYTWVQISPGIEGLGESEQRVLVLGTQFVMLVSNGFELSTYTSDDGSSWSSASMPYGLPLSTKVRQIISDGTTLYYGEGNAIYTSTDAKSWTSHALGEQIATMIMYWNNQVWALVKKTEGYELATYSAGTLTLTGLTAKDEFPISDFASVTFKSASGRERAMIIGGFAENGKSLNTRWNIEYVQYMNTDKGEYRLEEFSIDRPTFSSMTGISVVWYNDQLLLFGGVDEKMNYLGRDILISNDEGLTWVEADSSKNQLPETYQARQKQSALVRDNNIYIFGGQDQTTTFSDVYRGRLNSIDW